MIIQCPACQQEYEVPIKYINKKVQCEICNEKFYVEESLIKDFIFFHISIDIPKDKKKYKKITNKQLEELIELCPTLDEDFLKKLSTNQAKDLICSFINHGCNKDNDSYNFYIDKISFK